HWLILAGEQALHTGASETALTFFHQALDQQEKSSTPKHEVSRTYRLIGRTYFGMGKVQESGQAVQQSLELCGIHIPKSAIGLIMGILWQGGKQALFQTRLIRPRKGDTDLLMESLKSSILVWMVGRAIADKLFGHCGVKSV
ncbi:MAG TPA: tetratricopeptide repeat protein, partial [Aggregatilineales bacterium]|nr:tetratricopeptide repeat protein [Aggregatilineales bacterium]